MSLARRTSPADSDALVVATLNTRNTADRWRERAPLLVGQLVDLDPDVIALQEVRRFPSQARRIARDASRGRGRPPRWRPRAAYKAGVLRLWEGLAVVSRLPMPGRARLDLGGQSRIALRVTVTLPDGRPLDVYTTHMADGDKVLRCAQAERLVAWMAERPGVPQVLMGDLNSTPGTGTLQILTRRLRSAYALVHGSEPARTVPSGIVLDYILVNDRVTVLDAWVAFDLPSPHDPTLLASDHFGLAATLTFPPPARPRPRR